jgi:hypothetical protein
MNAKLIELAELRAELMARAAIQRAELRQELASWRSPFTMVDQGLQMVSYIRNHVLLVVGVATLIAPLRPWRAVKWLQRGWLLWRMAGVVKRILPRF